MEHKDKKRIRPKIDVKGKSIPAVFLERVEMEPEATAFRFKDRGIYKRVTWKTYYQQVEAFCL